MKKLIIALVVLAAPTMAAAAQCGDRDALATELAERYDEHLVAFGMVNPETMLELFASVATGTWTALYTKADGTTCVQGSGSDFYQQQQVTQ